MLEHIRESGSTPPIGAAGNKNAPLFGRKSGAFKSLTNFAAACNINAGKGDLAVSTLFKKGVILMTDEEIYMLLRLIRNGIIYSVTVNKTSVIIRIKK